MENLKKIMGSDRSVEFDAIQNPVKAHLAKNDCQNLLNKLCLVQAFYNNININTLALSKDQKTMLPTVSNVNDRKVIIKQFVKHIQQIFELLNKTVVDKNLDEFLL